MISFSNKNEDLALARFFVDKKHYLVYCETCAIKVLRMQPQKYHVTKRDVVLIGLIGVLMFFSLVLGYDKSKYTDADLRKAENEHEKAESEHRHAYYDVMTDATIYSYKHPEYKKLRDMRFDFDFLDEQTKGLSGAERFAKRRQIVDEYSAQADSVREKLYRDYIDADSAYVATKQAVEQTGARLAQVRAEIRRADSVAKLPVGVRFVHNIKTMARDAFARPRGR